MSNSVYSPRKGAAKGARALVGSLVPVVVGAVSVVVADPDVSGDLRHAWPAIPAAVVVALANWFANWIKNR